MEAARKSGAGGWKHSVPDPLAAGSLQLLYSPVWARGLDLGFGLQEGNEVQPGQ